MMPLSGSVKLYCAFGSGVALGCVGSGPRGFLCSGALVPSVALSAQRTFGEALAPASISRKPSCHIKTQARSEAAPR
jgi:hypothetical protein